MPQNSAPPHSNSSAPDASESADPRSKVQGEGDYQAARRYREEVKEFLEHTDVEERAREAAPDSAKQERELALAEDRGKDRSKGDDPIDVGLMYPGRRTDDAQSGSSASSGRDQAKGKGGTGR